MKLSADAILFEDVLALELFYSQLELQGILRLSEDLKDNTDKILIKADLALKPSVFEKLREIRGSYQERFLVKITNELRNSIARFLTNHAVRSIEDWGFITRLYNIEGHRYESYIRNAFRNKRLAISCFILMNRNPDHYSAMLLQGLLTLAIVMYRFLQIRRIHIHAFLAGLLMDLADTDGSMRREASQDFEALGQLKRKSAELAGSLGAPGVVTNSILAQESFAVLASEIPEAIHETEDKPVSRMSLEEFLNVEGSEDTTEEPDSPQSEAAIAQITEALKFARYVFFLRERLGDDAHAAEEISFRTAYVAQKGFVSMKMAEPILRVFKEYELEIRAMMKVAELEQKCLHPPSAWAYPKPRATQVVCRLHKTECPYIKHGWDLNVVSAGEAYGWIGMVLEPGRYLKCKLEDELEDIFKLIKKK